MNKKQTIFTLLIAVFSMVFLSNCSVNQVSQAYNLTKCDYSYHSITDISLSGNKLGRSLSPVTILQLSSLLSGEIPATLPLQLTLNINVSNPQSSTAQMQGLSYAVAVDDIDLTQGSINQVFSVASGETKQLPINIDVDLAALMRQNTQKSILNIIQNIAGLSQEKSKVTVQLRPTFMVGGTPITSPISYPISFYIGGK